MNHLYETFKAWLDGVSFVAIFATIAGWLPEIAALFAIVYTGIRIYERRPWRKPSHHGGRRHDDD